MKSALGVICALTIASFIILGFKLFYIDRLAPIEAAPLAAAPTPVTTTAPTAPATYPSQGVVLPSPGAKRMRGADLYVDFEKLLGQRVIVRGRIYGTSARGSSSDGAIFNSDAATFVIRQIDSEILRRMLKNCSARECIATLEVTPALQESGDAFPRLTNPAIIESR